MDIHGLHRLSFRFYRKRRMRRFKETFVPSARTTILDVGGTSYNWEVVDIPCPITMLNVVVPEDQEQAPPNLSFVAGDGTDLRYNNGSFDIVFSNSVIEHLGSFGPQAKFAEEVRRVGKCVWVQTPARSFFVEPHLFTPFIHFLPKCWQRVLLRNFTVWGLFTRPTREQVDAFLNEVRLLDLEEMQRLFPDCEIHKERFLGLTKSYVAVRDGS